MKEKFWRSERGSVTPVWVFILGMVVLLGVAVVEREWANFKLKLLEETLDFAAEAAGRTHDGYANVTVTRLQRWTELECSEWLDDVCVGEWEWVEQPTRVDTQPISNERVSDIRQNWRSMAECGSDPWEPNWQCVSAVVDCQWIVFTEQMDQAAEQTFWGNWKNLSTAFVHPSSVQTTPSSQPGSCSPARRVSVSAMIEMRPLFGLVPWVHQKTLTGSSIIRLQPLVLQ